MRLGIRRSLAAAMVLLIATCVARAQQVMDQIPDDALVVLKIKDLDTTSKKVGKVMTELGVAAMQPGLDNPLGYFQNKTSVTQGMRTDGDLAVVYRDPEKTGEMPDKSIVVLVPIADYAAFVGNFKEPKVEGDITTVKMPHDGGDGFIAHWGNFAALSPSKAVLDHKPTAMLKITGDATNRQIAAHDVVMFVNVVALRPKAQAGLQQGQQIASGQIEGALAKDEKTEKFAPLVKAMIDEAFAAANAFVRDANSVTIALSFGDEGINSASMVDFQSDSYCGTIVSALKNTTEPLLKGLPTAKYLFYGGGVNQPDVTAKLFSDAAAPVLKELDAAGPEMKPAHDYVDALAAYLKATKRGAFGIVAPAGAIGQESIIQVLSIAEGDAPAMKASQMKMMKSQEELMKSLGLPGTAYNVTITPNAKTVDGVSFDSITTAMTGNANDPASRQQQQVLAMMYGPNGMNMLEGTINNDRLLVALGVPDDVLSAAIASAKSGAAPLHDSVAVKAVATHIPTSRMGEAYIPLDQIATTALGYFKTFGMPINVTLPADLPPIAVSIVSDGSAIRVESYIPTELVKQMVAGGMQAYMQAQGGGGGGDKDTDKDNDKDNDKDKDNGK